MGARLGLEQAPLLSRPRLILICSQDKPWYVLGISVADHFGDLKVKMSEQERQVLARNRPCDFRDLESKGGYRECGLQTDEEHMTARRREGGKEGRNMDGW